MSNKVEATAKDAEGRLESAIGDITGDREHQIKGQAKQIRAWLTDTTLRSIATE